MEHSGSFQTHSSQRSCRGGSESPSGVLCYILGTWDSAWGGSIGPGSLIVAIPFQCKSLQFYKWEVGVVSGQGQGPRLTRP